MTVPSPRAPGATEPSWGGRFPPGAGLLAVVMWASTCSDGPTPPPPPRATTISVSPATARLWAVGETVQMAAEVLDQYGEVMRIAVAWSSGDTVVAAVTASGLVTALAEGSATIIAAAEEARGTAAITVLPDPERAALVALYRATGGPDWANRDGWLSDAPPGDWYGVDTDDDGRVVAIDLGPKWDAEANRTIQQGMRGEIPPEIGELSGLTTLVLADNYLSGAIPAEIGSLTRLVRLDLGGNSLTNYIPPEIGNLANLTRLHLGNNILIGRIPPEIGGLPDLVELDLGDNMLFGEIPPEIGGPSGLTQLDLSGNRLTGPVPDEIGELIRLSRLDLSANRLTGRIPSTLEYLTSLTSLDLSHNLLTDPVPTGIGELTRLTSLDLSANELSGPIPRSVGGLANLTALLLESNSLTGPIAPDLGSLGSLRILDLSANNLAGPVPADLAALASLRAMILRDNAGLEGALPTELTALDRLEHLRVEGTELCAPRDPGFRVWMDGLNRPWIRHCGDGPPAYLVQAVQSRSHPVPLVAGDRALLRVFVTSGEATGQNIPEVRARFFVDGAETHVVTIPGGSTPIPAAADEGSLEESANAVIASGVVRPGLEMVVEIDPDGTLDPSLGIPRRIPETGRLALDVRAMPVMDLTFIPFIWTGTHDSSIVALAGAMAADPKGHETLGPTRTLLPVGELKVTAHAPVLTSSNNAAALLGETTAIRALEGGTGHYQGLMVPPVTGSAGVAYRPGRSSFSEPDGDVMAHELGHNMSLSHAPCGGPRRIDPDYPYPNGAIGAWGHDFPGGGKLVPPATSDLMSYCPPHWISAYHFSHALAFRLSDADSIGLPDRDPAARSLLLWGGADADGRPFLEPAFVVDAPPSLPESAGAHRIVARTAGGAELFSLSFDMPAVADGDGGSRFAFVIPASPGTGDELAVVSLVGPGGSAILDGDGEVAMAILRDPETGRVRGILRDGFESALASAEAAAHSPDRELELLFSRGIPRGGAWRR